MAVHNEEWNDDVNQYDEPEERIWIRISVDGGRVSGQILEDALGKKRTKIVFVTNWWRGPELTHGLELRARVERDTKPEDPRRGALIVEPLLPTLNWGGGQYGACSHCKALIRVRDPRTCLALNQFVCAECKTPHTLPAR